MFFKKKRSDLQEKSATPYLNAGRQYSELHGSHIRNAKHWRYIALLFGLIAFISVCDRVYNSNALQIRPYAFLVKNNQIYPLGTFRQEITQKKPLENFIIENEIARFVENVASRVNDKPAQMRLIQNAYNLIPAQSEAYKTLEKYLRQYNPVMPLRTVTVSNIYLVERDTESQTRTRRKYTATWTETTYKNGGETENPGEADIVIVFEPVEAGNLPEVLSNPIGLKVEEIFFRKRKKMG